MCASMLKPFKMGARPMSSPTRRSAHCKRAGTNAVMITQAEERLLIERCQEGEKAAFDKLFRAYEKRVYNLAYRLSGHYDEANDISVDAFLRVFQAIRLFRGDANFSTWLFRIVTNVFLDRRKRMKNKQHLSL